MKRSDLFDVHMAHEMYPTWDTRRVYLDINDNADYETLQLYMAAGWEIADKDHIPNGRSAYVLRRRFLPKYFEVEEK